MVDAFDFTKRYPKPHLVPAASAPPEFPQTLEGCHAEIAALREQQEYLFSQLEQLKLRLSF